MVNVPFKRIDDLGFWLSELRAGRAFGQRGSISAGTGNNPHVQLFNPGGSGVTALVYAATVSTTTAQQILWGFYDTALSSLHGTGVNLLRGGAAGKCDVRSQASTSLLGTLIHEQEFAASDGRILPPVWLGELGEGEGLIVVGNTQNTLLRLGFRWVEI